MSDSDDISTSSRKQFCMQLHIRCFGVTAHESHIVKRRDQHTAIGSVKMKVLFKPGISCCSGSAAIEWRGSREAILRAATELGARPWQLVVPNCCTNTRAEISRRLNCRLQCPDYLERTTAAENATAPSCVMKSTGDRDHVRISQKCSQHRVQNRHGARNLT